MAIFKADDWYWVIGDDRARVFSSKKDAYVYADDTEYQAWLALENTPSTSSSEDEFARYMSEAYPSIELTLPVALIAYANTRKWETTIDGHNVSISVVFSSENSDSTDDAGEIAAWVQSMFERMPEIVTKIKSGDIKTRAEIDEALSA